ncbi:hypothetical protein ARMGADRAFT_896182, partial [Armillaria gallica]
ENLSTDPKECLRLIKNSDPPPFTDARFRSIVYGTPVNFDEILSYFKSLIGTDTQWRFVWVRYVRVLNHIFSGQESELNTYNEFINDIFDHHQTWMHPQIIALDRSCHALITASQGRVLFSDIQRFTQLKESHFAASGIAYVAPP